MPNSSGWHAKDRVKACTSCKCPKPIGEFSAYPYTTKQGKRSVRYESRCLDCNRKRSAAYRERNPHAVVAQNARRIVRDPDIFKKLSRRYRETEQGRLVKAAHQRLRKARLRSASGDDEEIRQIYLRAIELEKVVANCPVFDIPELGRKMHVDHIVPLSKGGAHEACNLQILPSGLNLRKGTKCLR